MEAAGDEKMAEPQQQPGASSTGVTLHEDDDHDIGKQLALSTLAIYVTFSNSLTHYDFVFNRLHYVTQIITH